MNDDTISFERTVEETTKTFAPSPKTMTAATLRRQIELQAYKRELIYKENNKLTYLWY